jgi:hypothetical protein
VLAPEVHDRLSFEFCIWHQPDWWRKNPLKLRKRLEIEIDEVQRERMHFCYKHATIAACIEQRPKVPIQMCNCLQRGPDSQMLAACCAAGRRGAPRNKLQTRRWMLGCEQTTQTGLKQPPNIQIIYTYIYILRKSGSPHTETPPFGGAKS